MQRLNLKRKLSAGTTLVEILVAAAILGLVMTSIVSVITLSVKNLSEAKQRAIAVKYGQEGMEMFRRQRNAMGWETFSQTLDSDPTGAGGVLSYCLPSISATNPVADTTWFKNLTNGVCVTTDSADYIDTTQTASQQVFQRQADVTFEKAGATITAVDVVVKVSWAEGDLNKETTVSEKFKDYLPWNVQPGTVFEPAP